MIFMHDTRDKRGKHDNVTGGLTAMGHEIVRSKLYAGDITLLHDHSTCIDLKQSLNEVESNLVQSHERFRRECERARAAGIRLVILVEDESIYGIDEVAKWENPRYKRWMRLNEAHKAGRMLHVKIPARPPIRGDRLHKAMVTMTERYGVEWQFSRHDEVAKRVCEILGVDTRG